MYKHKEPKPRKNGGVDKRYKRKLTNTDVKKVKPVKVVNTEHAVELIILIIIILVLALYAGVFVGKQILTYVQSTQYISYITPENEKTRELILHPRQSLGIVRKVSADVVEETHGQEKQRLGNIWTGTASWYGQDAGECLGCHPQMIMANGDYFDETKLTVAFNWLPLNTYVKVTNNANGESVVAKVTDTGGFNQLNRIIDLSQATKEFIGCNDLCGVTVGEVL